MPQFEFIPWHDLCCGFLQDMQILLVCIFGAHHPPQHLGFCSDPGFSNIILRLFDDKLPIICTFERKQYVLRLSTNKTH
jgi:hypothetical protein